MALHDLEVMKMEFEEARAKFAGKAIAAINKRLKVIQKEIPGAEFLDAMGMAFLHDKTASAQRDDPLRLAYEAIEDGKSHIETEHYGGDVPEEKIEANRLLDKFGDLMAEIQEIGIYINDELRYTYG